MSELDALRDQIDGIDRDFFRRNYPEPIFENGIECRHMVRLRIEL